MKKTLIAFLVLVVVASGSLWWYFHPKSPAPKLSETIKAIPINAAFIIEARHPGKLNLKLSTSNLLWKGLLTLPFFSETEHQFKTLDSLLLTDQKLGSFRDSITLFISAHPASSGSCNFLFSLGLPSGISTSDIDQLITKNITDAHIQKRQYDEVTISTVELNTEKLSYAFHQNILLLSFSGMLLEDALRQLNIGTSLLDNTTFERLLKAQEAGSDFTIYLNPNLLPGFLEHFTSGSHKSFISSLRYFNDWIVLDGTSKNESLAFSGFSASGDSVSHFLDLFKGQEPQRITLGKIAPEGTALLLHFGISNIRIFYSAYKKYLEGQHAFFDYQRNLSELSKEYHIDVNKQFLDLLEKEMALVIRTPANEDYAAGSYAIFRTIDSEQAFTVLQTRSDSIIRKRKLKRDTAVYHSYSILHLPIRNFLPLVLGQSFESIKENYFIKMDNCLVFANSIAALKNLINDYENGRTLENNAAFSSNSENFSSESNIFLYGSVNKSFPLVKGLFNEHYANSWEKSRGTVRKFDFFTLQFSSTASFFYTNAFLNYTANQNEAIQPLWETRLDTTVSSEPVLVINHLTQEKEIFVQDDANTIYLISANGTIIWKKHLGEKIISKIVQIDVLKNNKLQLLFNTAGSIFLLDRKGNAVSHFPIKLKAKASNGLSVFDYRNKKDYRILLATEDKKIVNYSASTGLENKIGACSTEANVYGTIEHAFIENKDYILFADVLGKIYVLDPHAEVQLNLSERLKSPLTSYFLKQGPTLKESQFIASDSTGQVQFLSLSGEHKELKLKDFDSRPMFNYFIFQGANSPVTPEANTPVYLFALNHELSTFAGSNQLLFSYGFKENLSIPPQLLLVSDTLLKVGVTLVSTNEVFLFNPDGTRVKGFPCPGNTAFCISKLTTSGQALLICGSNKHIVAYSLPD